MKAIAAMDVRMRYGICAVLLALSLLLVGAGRMNGELKGRSAAIESGKGACRDAALSLSQAVPVEYRKGWVSMASQNPGLFIRACHTDLRAVPSSTR